jgi:hypothetical protein
MFDYDEFYDIQPNAECVDCGAAFSRAEDDRGPKTCDTCSDRRDAHTTRLERRLAMVKARLVARRSTPDVA